ncbi:hypothetical protein OROGR_025271 [Orobanche gracilis]
MEDGRVVVLGIFAPGIVVAQPDKPPVYAIDTAAHFYIDQATEKRDELIDWARETALKLKFAIIIGKSDNDNDIRKPYFRLDCERSVRYVSTNKKLKSDQIGTRKCGCPFRLCGYFHADKKWHLTVVNGIHNHKLDKEVEGHLIVGRLKLEERQFMDELKRNLVPPKNIISTLKERDPNNNKATSKQLYNARHRFKLAPRTSMTEIQHLQKAPREWLVMDSTYNTNKYKVLLFEIVRFTSTGRTFSVGFAWVSNEKEDNFIWVLQQCTSLLRNEDLRPRVILTDRDFALMNAVEEVFPTSAAMVCRFHVTKNVTSRMKEVVKIKNEEDVKQSDVWDNITNAFHDLVESPTETDYVEDVMEFRKICARWPKFLCYVEETVLDTNKEKLVNAWVDQ